MKKARYFTITKPLLYLTIYLLIRFIFKEELAAEHDFYLFSFAMIILTIIVNQIYTQRNPLGYQKPLFWFTFTCIFGIFILYGSMNNFWYYLDIFVGINCLISLLLFGFIKDTTKEGIEKWKEDITKKIDKM